MFLDDHSRVALTQLDGDEYSDYINANFIHVSTISEIYNMK